MSKIVPEMTLSLADLRQPNLDQKLLNYKEAKFYVDVEFADGRKVVHAKDLIISYYLWETLRIANMDPIIKDFLVIDKFNNDILMAKNTELYIRVLDQYPDIDVSRLIDGPWIAMNKIFNLCFGDREAYIQSSDALDLVLMNQQPALRKLSELTFPDAEGTDKAEKRLEAASTELIDLLGTRGKLEFNPLINFMECGVLNPRQIVQVHIAYGPRADITDQLAKHIISESTMSGLKSVADFAIESLSAKKSTLYSRTVIEDTQYFNRKQRLSTNGIRKLYRGDCGNRITVPFVLPTKMSTLKNFFGKRFIEDGKVIALTSKNVAQYAGKRVEFISPLTCRHTDGICEHCMGLNNNHVAAFFSPGIHIGNLAAAFFSGSVSQMVLSAKHLIKTATKQYFMNTAAGTYFACKGTGIFLHPKLITRGYTDCAFKFADADFLGQLTDLHLKGINVLPEASIFSKMSGAQFCVKINGEWTPMEIFSLDNEGLCPFLSTNFLQHMRDHYDDLILDESAGEGSVLVPLKGFDWHKPVMRYIAINDDMIAFSNRLINFFKGKIKAHTSISGCIQELAGILYSKSKLPYVYLEIVLRAFILGEITPEMVAGTCTSAIFGSTEDVLSERSISNKFSYQKVMSYFDDPEVFTEIRPYGYYDPFFGFMKPKKKELKQ